MSLELVERLFGETQPLAPIADTSTLEILMRRLVTTLAICGLAAALLAPGIVAKTSGPGTSTGTGTVFFPNPAAALGIPTLTDQKDADYHAVHDAQVAGFGVGSEAGAIGEGSVTTWPSRSRTSLPRLRTRRAWRTGTRCRTRGMHRTACGGWT